MSSISTRCAGKRWFRPRWALTRWRSIGGEARSTVFLPQSHRAAVFQEQEQRLIPRARAHHRRLSRGVQVGPARLHSGSRAASVGTGGQIYGILTLNEETTFATQWHFAILNRDRRRAVSLIIAPTTEDSYGNITRPGVANSTHHQSSQPLDRSMQRS
jgi:hypothetical protein